MTFIDLFSGVGGFRISLEDLGFRCVGFSEINKNAIEVYKNNFDTTNEIEFGDITKIKKLPKVDLITAGIPCQPWSLAGKMKGFKDTRGSLWIDTINLINKSKPRSFILENVKGLTNKNNKRSLDFILNSFKNYSIYYKVLNSLDFGLKQKRDRLFIVGLLGKKDFEFPKVKSQDRKSDFFICCDTRDNDNTIHSWDLIETTKREKNICMIILKNRRKKKYSDKDGSPLSFSILKDLIPDLKLKELTKLKNKNILKKVGSDFEFVNSNSLRGLNNIHRIYLIDSKSYPTIVSGGTKDFIATIKFQGSKKEFLKEVYYKNNFRQFTIEELSEFQGFPKSFKHSKSYLTARTQIGNSVPINVVRQLIKAIKEAA